MSIFSEIAKKKGKRTGKSWNKSRSEKPGEGNFDEPDVPDGEYMCLVKAKPSIGKKGGKWEGEPIITFRYVLDDDSAGDENGKSWTKPYNLSPANAKLEWMAGACCSLFKQLIPDAEDDIENSEDFSILEDLCDEMDSAPISATFFAQTKETAMGKNRNLHFRKLLSENGRVSNEQPKKKEDSSEETSPEDVIRKGDFVMYKPPRAKEASIWKVISTNEGKELCNLLEEDGTRRLREVAWENVTLLEEE